MRPPTILIVRDDGLGNANPSFLIDNRTWYVAKDGLDGFDGIESSVSTKDYAIYDGGFLLGERSTVKDRTITAWYVGDQATGRAEAESFFRSGYRYDVHINAEGRKRWFSARQNKLTLTVDNTCDRQKLIWTCIALDPYLISEDEKSFDLAAAVGKHGFPFVSFAERYAPTPEPAKARAMVLAATEPERPANIKGFITGVISRKINMRVGGSAVAFPRFEIAATGDVVNPALEVENIANGQVACNIGLSLSMKAGDTLVIDFDQRPTTIELNGQNVSQRVLPGSRLICSLEPDVWQVSWSSQSGDASMHVTPTIRERYSTI